VLRRARADLIVGVDPDATEKLLRQPGARRFDPTGKPMTGWLLVAPEVLVLDAALDDWVKRSVRSLHALSARRK
jgi:hypothetical protein